VPDRAFGGKKAAPFKSGGGRNPKSPKTAKGTPRKPKGGGKPAAGKKKMA
jgi:hypothetical protein